jgi:alpha-D-xyloside xylohydrolase
MFTNHPTLQIQEGFEPLLQLEEPERLENGMAFSTPWGTLAITAYAENIFRIRLETCPLPDYGLISGQANPPSTRMLEISENFRLEAGEVSMEICSAPFALRLKRGDEILLQSSLDETIICSPRLPNLAHAESGWLLSFALNVHEPIYGLGEKFSAVNKRGQLIVSSNEDATGVNAEFSYKNTPFAWSPKGWGLLVHTPARVVHGVGYPIWSHRSYILQIEEPNLDLFLITADDPEAMLKSYTYLTGRTELPPRWSYGIWMSRAFYPDAKEVIRIAKKLRASKIPTDVIVLDGRAWHDVTNRFDFTWDKERYPDPAAFIQALEDEHMRLCLWEYPYIATTNPIFDQLAEKGFLLQDSNGAPCLQKWHLWPFETDLPHLPPSGVIDFTNPEAAAWYNEAHQELFEMGVSVMKSDYGEALPPEAIAHNGDRGERLHNAYALLYNRCVYEATKKHFGEDAMIWARAGWTGSQRYPIGWGGDPQSDWSGLAASIRGALSWGLSGGPFYSHDVGGYTSPEPDPELFVRWTQAGVLSSHMRFHGLGPREPWAFGPEVESILREWLSLRYQLIPYLQACAIQARQTGLPVMRAMALAFPGQALCRSFEEQYLLGPSLFVAPVVNPGGNTVFYLPQGGWYDFWSGEYMQGPDLIQMDLPLNRIPLFGREGHILPLGPAAQHTGELEPELDLDEIWVFGTPKYGIELPGLTLTPNSGSHDKPLKGIPEDVKIKQW